MIVDFSENFNGWVRHFWKKSFFMRYKKRIVKDEDDVMALVKELQNVDEMKAAGRE